VRSDWLFEVVFDYGEHDDAAPTTAEVRSWSARKDPFSLFRSTFDVRTYRLCRRVLMFHHFPEELAGTQDYLVRSTDLEYREARLLVRRRPGPRASASLPPANSLTSVVTPSKKLPPKDGKRPDCCLKEQSLRPLNGNPDQPPSVQRVLM
jgi:hypothetical protein